MVLFLFVVMLLNAPVEDVTELRGVRVILQPGPLRVGALLAAVLGVELGWALSQMPSGGGGFGAAAVSSVKAVGIQLFTVYAFPFEVTSVLILVAMVGAVVLAGRRAEPWEPGKPGTRDEA
jgi:NADH-quinone oxidoreductase subunit J